MSSTNEYGVDDGVELAMRRAGVPLDSELGRVFAKSYQGDDGWEPDDVAGAYQRLAKEVGGPSTAADSDREMQAVREDVRYGGVGDTGQPEHATSRRAIIDKHLARHAAGTPREDMMGDAFHDLVAHAVETGHGIIEP